MPTIDPRHYSNHPDYFRATQFPEPETGRVYATWGCGVPTLLPPCTHVALGTHVKGNSFAFRVVSRDDVARLAAKWWHPLDEDFVRIEGCPEGDWRRLLEAATEYEVEMPRRVAPWRNN